MVELKFQYGFSNLDEITKGNLEKVDSLNELIKIKTF